MTADTAPESSMIERVARAICGKKCDMPRCSCQPDAHSKSVCREISFAQARRAVEAMRTPTEAMYQANDQALHNAKRQFGWSRKERNARLAHRTKCVLRWTAMIDAALLEQEAVTNSKDPAHSRGTQLKATP